MGSIDCTLYSVTDTAAARAPLRSIYLYTLSILLVLLAVAIIGMDLGQLGSEAGDPEGDVDVSHAAPVGEISETKGQLVRLGNGSAP